MRNRPNARGTGSEDDPRRRRDASLRRISRLNRWLVAGALAATGLLTEVAAQARPGRSARGPQVAAPGSVGTGAANGPSATASSTPPPTPVHHRRHRRVVHHAAAAPVPAAAPSAPASPAQTPTPAPAPPAPAPQAQVAAPTPAPQPPSQAPQAAPAGPAPVTSGGS